MSSIAQAAGKLVPDLAKDLFDEKAASYLQSEEAHLAQTRIGTIFNDLKKTRYEPLWKKQQAQGREVIESVIRQVPESQQAHLHDVVVNNKTANNPVVAKAASRLGAIYHSSGLPYDAKTMDDATVIGKWTKWNQQNAKRNARKAVFGENDEALTGIIKHAHNERGLIYANTVADNMSIYFHDYKGGGALPYKVNATKGAMAVPLRNVGSAYNPATDSEGKFRHYVSSMYVSRAALPHLGQILNPMLQNGVWPVVKAMTSIIRGDKQDMARVVNAGIMEEEMFYELTNRPTSKLGKFIDSYVRMPGFKQVRKFEIIASALSSKYAARELAEDIIANPNDKRAIAHLKFLGIDAQKIASRGAITAEEEDLAMYRGADHSMFFRSSGNTPPSWDKTSISRIMFMYKHYAFNQSKFLKDVLKRDFAQSHSPAQMLKTTAMLAVAFPAVGALIHAGENVATGHDPTDNLDDYLDNFARVGGLGIGYSILRSARRHAVASFLIGPVFGTVTDLGQDSYDAVYGKHHNWKPVERDVVSKVPIVGPALSHTLIPGTGKQ